MNNLDRKAKLEKALALLEEPREAAIMAGGQNYFGFILGAEHENERLAPLHAVLLEAVEALEWVKPILHGEELQHVEEALAKLDEALEGMGG